MPFEKGRVSPVESLILAQAAYFEFEKVRLPLAIRSLPVYASPEELVKNTWREESNLELLKSLISHPAWGSIKVVDQKSFFNVTKEEQFAAMTFDLGHGVYYMAFRGTDNSFAGWKEDFNMSYMKTIPSQTTALEYAESTIKKYPGAYYIGGHSKGGNLSHYVINYLEESLATCVLRADSFDGPGLYIPEGGLPHYESRKGKIKKYIPENSIIGRIYAIEGEELITIKSQERLLFEHDPFSWQLKGNGFDIMSQPSSMSRFFSETIETFNETLDEDVKKKCIDSIYTITKNMEMVYFSQAESHWRDTLKSFWEGLKGLDPAVKEDWRYLARVLRETSVSKSDIITPSFIKKIKKGVDVTSAHIKDRIDQIELGKEKE